MIQGNIIRLIVVEESANDAEVILNTLRKARFPIRPKHVEDAEDLQAALSQQEWDLVISVPVVVDFTLSDVCELIKNSNQDIPVIALCHKFTGANMANLIEQGAHHVAPYAHDSALQQIVQQELNNLECRRQLRHVEQMHRQSQKNNLTLLSTSRDAISYVHDGMHIHANPSYLEMFGAKDMEYLEALPVMDLVAPEHHSKFKEFMREYMTDENEEDRDIQLIGLRLQKNKRVKFKLKMEVSQALYDNEKCIQIIIREESNNKELERKLQEINKLDQLTGLYNRQHFIALLDKALGKAIENRVRSVVMYLSLDNYRDIRDRVGIGGSDPIIENMAKALKEIKGDLVLARFNESIFTLLLHDKDIKQAETCAMQLCKAVEDCVTELPEQSIVTTCSIGMALVLASAGTPQSVLSDAHAACQIAIKKGGNQVSLYKAVVKSGSTSDDNLLNVAKMIETGIEEKRFSLAYQPIVSLRDDNDAIYEVFLRMVDSEGENVPPGTLFAAAEKANLSIQLDKWVLKEAARILKQHENQGKNIHFFIKLSDQAVKDETLLLFIHKLLKATQISGKHFTIEISEAIAISQIKFAKAFITRLNRMGCRSALEHFGTGLNSETTLKHLPVTYVKIDGSYAKGLSSNKEHQDSVRSIVELAHNYKKLTIAESVEDANSLTVLWQCDVDFAQGHYIQEPSDTMDYDFSEE